MKHRALTLLFCLPLACMLAACSQTPAKPGMRLGKPYSVDGTTYTPEYDPGYDKIGEASWYGPGFHGKHTANGEVFNQNDLTAAHPTLPMPCLVRVTNLNNGKSVIVRVNDRGPFKSNRIIDLSKKAARQIGIVDIAKVRVQYLPHETEEHLASIRNGGKKVIDMAAYNEGRHNAAPGKSGGSEQIVESTFANTEAGQTVNDAAPIISVGSGDIAQPEPAAKALPSLKSEAGPPHKKISLIKEAYAGDESAEAAKPAVAAAELAPAANTEKRFVRDELGQPVALKGAKEPAPDAQVKQADSKPAKQAQKEEAAPAAKTKLETAATGPYFIQVGSFSSEENARKLDPKLSAIGEFSVKQVETGGKTWWNVRLGPFRDKGIAGQALEKVHAAGLPDARVIRL